MAQQALGWNPGNASVQAEASLVLCHAFALDSRFRNANIMALRAHRLFVLDSNGQGQVEALGILSFTACVLGMNDRALEAARDGTSTTTEDTLPIPQAWGLNYSGVASLWAKDFATARAVLESSIWFANQAADAPPHFSRSSICASARRSGW